MIRTMLGNGIVRTIIAVLIASIWIWIALPDSPKEYFYAPGWYVIDVNELQLQCVASRQPLVSGCCVDNAMTVLSILERNDLLTDNIKVAIGKAMGEWHCQVVLVDRVVVYYQLSGVDIYAGESEFMSEPPVFYDYDVFRAAARRYRDLSYIQMRDFAARYR